LVEKLDEPPATLPAQRRPTWQWRERMSMIRIYHQDPSRDGTAYRTFGPLARFDPHVRDGQQQPREDPHGRGTLYLAADLATALAEFYSGQRPEISICPHTRAAWMSPSKSITLLDIGGEGALGIGAPGTLQWGNEPRRLTQRWGRRIYEQYRDLDGIRYQSAHQGGVCIVLWERAPVLRHRVGGDRRLWAVWSRVTVALAGQRRTPRRIAVAECARCRNCGFAD
jgi:hypothetical protein